MHRKGIWTMVMMLAVALPAGCKQEASPVKPSPPESAPLAQSEPRAEAADPAADDPAAPEWLPTPDEISGWLRTENVRVTYAGEWGTLRDPDLRQQLGAFRIERVSVFAYQSVPPNPHASKAEVTLVEAHGSEDAYALFTSQMPGIPDEAVGGLSSFAERSDHHDGTCWQGDYFLRVRMKQSTPTADRVWLERLVAGLVKPIPSAPPPGLIGYLPIARRKPGQLWVVRKHLQTLPESILSDVLRKSAVQTTQALGLGLDTLTVVAAYDAGEGEDPNIVWLVQYPDAAGAAGAYGRYKKLLTHLRPAPEVLMESPLGEGSKPASRFLCGTWTAGQESIPTMHVLPRIKANLP